MKTLQDISPNASATKGDGGQPDPFILFPKDIRPHLKQVTESFAADPLLVAAAASAVVGAGAGANIRVRMPGRQMPPAFNLAIAAPGKRRLPWLDYLTSPIRTYIEKKLLAENRGAASEHILKGQLKRLDDQLRTVDSTRTPQQLETIQRHRADTLAALKPCLIAGSCHPAHLKLAASLCFDSSVQLANGTQDLLAEMRGLKAKDAALLAQQLNASWDGEGDNSFSLLQSFTGSMGDMQKVVISRPEFPMLVLGDEPASRSVPLQALDSRRGWPDAVARKALLRRLAALHSPASIGFTQKAGQLLEDFSQETTKVLQALPPGIAGHLNWQPDLAAKLGAIFAILHHEDNSLPASLAVDENGLYAVITVLARPLLSRSLSSWTKVVSDPSVKLATDMHGATDNEKRILKKITDRPGITKRQLQRSFDSMMADERNAAVDTLVGRDLVRLEGNSLHVI